MNDSFIAKSMFDILAGNDKNLASCFLAMQERALKDWIPLLKVYKGSHAGLVHLINVGRNVDKLIPKDRKEKLSDGEIFLLLAAVLFHDIGRILDGVKVPSCKKRGACLVDKHGKDISPCIMPGGCHYKKSEDIILQVGLEKGLPDALAVKYCALLAYCHGLSEPPHMQKDKYTGVDCTLMEIGRSAFRNTSIEPYGSVRIPLLAALLRIADETENLWTRAIDIRWQNYLEKYKADLSKACRRRVEDVEFSHAGECIVMHLEEQKMENGEKQNFIEAALGIEKMLSGWSPELKPLGIDFKQVYFETGGKLWKFSDGQQIDQYMSQVLKDDARTIQYLLKTLRSLSEITMGYEEFTWTAVEAELGRPLGDQDKWLIERMADWNPGTISVDAYRKSVHIKKGTKWNELSKELIGGSDGIR
jgi:hypothetical protein